MSFSQNDVRKNKIDGVLNFVPGVGMALAVVLLVLIGIVSGGSVAHAATASDYPYTTSWNYCYSTAEDGWPCSDRESTIISKFPIYGYKSGDYWRMALVDFENQVYYSLESAASDDAVNLMYKIQNTKVVYTSDSGTSTVQYSRDEAATYDTVASEYNGSGNCIKIQLNDYSILSRCTATVFESVDALKNFISTGELVGVIHEGDVVIDGRDFGGDYDPDVPIPQLSSISHEGFTVTNSAENLEIDLVVKSRFCGLKHGDSSSYNFIPDSNLQFNNHYYDCTATADIGYTKSTFNLLDDFGCTNAADLRQDGIDYFNAYSTHKDLPSYNWLKHSGSDWTREFAVMKAAYQLDSGLGYGAIFESSDQAITKYYVRFYELRMNEDGVGAAMVPGQWYCYTFSNFPANGEDSVVISPVGGDEDGNPIEEDPIEGGQDDEGNITVPDPTDPGYWDNEGSILTMIKDLMGDFQDIISYYAEFGSFLAATFEFIPYRVWEIIIAGIRISVICVFWRFVFR